MQQQGSGLTGGSSGNSSSSSSSARPQNKAQSGAATRGQCRHHVALWKVTPAAPALHRRRQPAARGPQQPRAPPRWRASARAQASWAAPSRGRKRCLHGTRVKHAGATSATCHMRTGALQRAAARQCRCSAGIKRTPLTSAAAGSLAVPPLHAFNHSFIHLIVHSEAP